MSVGEGDNASSHAACKMWGGALIAHVVHEPAVSAAPGIGAVAGFVSRVLAVTPEAVTGWKTTF